MSDSAVAVIGLLLLGWALVSGALSRLNISGPLVFMAGGYLLANPGWGAIGIDVEAAAVHTAAEVALALVLFSDAARVNLRELQRDVSLPLRLLGVGLPLSMVFGGVLAAQLIFDLPWALAGFVGVALAPTDAALSVEVINNERIPLRLRRALNVESGLNDGIATPVITVLLAVAASQIGIVTGSESLEAGSALRELGAGILVGAVLGLGGAVSITWATRRDWIVGGGRRIATLAIAVSALAVALAVDGNGFIAAFVAGIAFGAALDQEVTDLEQAAVLPELGGELMGLVVWFLFGATLVPVMFEVLDGWTIVYALASLTVVRMIPVALSMVRSGLDRASIAFVAWFGPRGLASVVFALLAIEQLGESDPAVERAVAAVSMTVLLSVILHGLSARPGARRYLQSEDKASAAHAPRARPVGFLRNDADI